MDMLMFAVFDFFPVALFLFVFGCVYRFLRFVLFWRLPPKAPARFRGVLKAGIYGLIMTFLHPIIFSIKKGKWDFVFGMMFLHILGVLPLIFLLSQHIEFFAYLLPIDPLWNILRGFAYPNLPIYSYYQLGIPLSMMTGWLAALQPIHTPVSHMMFGYVNSIWGPLTIVLNGDTVALLAMLGVCFKLGHKIVHRVYGHKYLKLSDFLDLLLLLAILVTGYLAARHWPHTMSGTNVVMYNQILGLHVFFASVLLAAIPFTKYWHIVFGYWYAKFHEWYDLRLRKGVV